MAPISQLAGEEHFSQAQTEIWARLADAEFLAECLPGLESVERDESGRLLCHVRPGLSFFQGTLKVTLDILDKHAPESMRIRVYSKGIGSSADVETKVELSVDDTGMLLSWNAEVKQLGGLLKTISRGLIAAAARKIIAEGWTRFRNRLG